MFLIIMLSGNHVDEKRKTRVEDELWLAVSERERIANDGMR